MRANEIITEAMKLPPGSLDRVVQYISGPMLPKVNGNYRLEDVIKRVKELKAAIARAKQSGSLDVNSAGYKAAVAEIKKWADWLEDSQAPAQPGNPVVTVAEDLNPNLGKILELANKFAIAIANMKIYTDDIFANHLKLGGLGGIVDHLKKIYTDQNYLSGAREVAQLKQELGKLGVKVDYNESFPTDYTLQIPGQSRPYTFNIIQLLKDAMSSYKTKAVK